MRLTALLLLLSLSAHADDDWWSESDRTMVDYLNDGYVVVGFSTNSSDSGLLTASTMIRYVLQKLDGDETLAVLCSESVRGKSTSSQTCFESLNH